MAYCSTCGHKLVMKDCGMEGLVPYCEYCKAFRFPTFSTAVSMIVLNEAKDRILLISQYGRKDRILVAGYVNKGEDAEHAVKRELLEETGLGVSALSFNRTEYHQASNTLMLNWTVVSEGNVTANEEIDSWDWYTFSEAEQVIRPNSLAQRFLLEWLRNAKRNTETQ